MDRREREAGACTDTPRVRRPGVVNPEGNRQEPLRATPLVRVPRTKAPGATNAMARGWVGVERTRQRKRKKGGEEERIAKYAAGARKRGACLWTVRGKLRVTDQGVGKGAARPWTRRTQGVGETARRQCTGLSSRRVSVVVRGLVVWQLIRHKQRKLDESVPNIWKRKKKEPLETGPRRATHQEEDACSA